MEPNAGHLQEKLNTFPAGTPVLQLKHAPIYQVLIATSAVNNAVMAGRELIA
jgi:hypothetical protein